MPVKKIKSKDAYKILSNNKPKTLPHKEFNRDMILKKRKPNPIQKKYTQEIEEIQEVVTPFTEPKEETHIPQFPPIKENKKLPNHIEEYFAKIEGSKEAFHTRELFRAESSDVDLKTDLKWEEITIINCLIWNNDLLKRKGLKPIYTDFINQYLRLKISLDRKSRGEFVSVNRSDKTEEAINLMGSLSNINNPKK